MCDYTKDIKFIEKRISEQNEEFNFIWERFSSKLITKSRHEELFDSVWEVANYFIGLKHKYYESENKLPTVHE